MNDGRRRRLREAVDNLSRASTVVETAYNEESDCFDNYPENLQGTDRYDQMETAVDNLSDAVEKINEAMECIEAAIGV